MANTDLKIRVKSRLGTTQQVLLYQEAVTLNVKNFKIAAWEHQYIAPGAQMRALLPTDISIGSMEVIGHDGKIMTKLLNVEYNTAWDIYNNGGALDIRKSSEPFPEGDTIEIHNKNKATSEAVVAKNGKPLFACNVRPGFKVNFAIHPKLFVALSDFEITDPFFDAATISRRPVEIEYEGQQYLTIILSENESTGEVTVDYNFDKFEE
ncbi:MAG: hypothetical protein K2J73_07660 [Oscillospiraceae bacterium]|nr:hypothetical protein [Oscillospiraceae bacterium]